MRRTFLVMALIAFTLWVREDPARAQRVRVQVPTVQTARLRTSLYVGNQRFARGQPTDLFAILLDHRNQPIPGARVDFRVQASNTNSVCTARTDARGRAHCYFLVPELHYSLQYSLTARYLGDASRAPAEASSVLRMESDTYGELRIPDGVEVSMGLNEALEGHRRSLRAQVRHGGAPVTQGSVLFAANGVDLGQAPVNAAGLAHFNWTPREAELSRFFFDSHGMPGQWRGNLQAWYRPPDGGPLLPGVAVHEARVGRWDPCRLVRGANQSMRCSLQDATGVGYRLAGQPMVTVRRDEFGQGTIDRRARVELSVPVPPEPPRNADCDPFVLGFTSLATGPDPCRRTCERLEHYVLAQTGDVMRLVGQPSGTSGCDRRLTQTIRVPERALRTGHDACAIRALQLGISTWNHTASSTYKQPVLAVFLFRDMHTERTSGGWRMYGGWEAQIRVAELSVNASVNCR